MSAALQAISGAKRRASATGWAAPALRSGRKSSAVSTAPIERSTTGRETVREPAANRRAGSNGGTAGPAATEEKRLPDLDRRRPPTKRLRDPRPAGRRNIADDRPRDYYDTTSRCTCSADVSKILGQRNDVTRQRISLRLEEADLRAKSPRRNAVPFRKRKARSFTSSANRIHLENLHSALTQKLTGVRVRCQGSVETDKPASARSGHGQTDDAPFPPRSSGCLIALKQLVVVTY